MGSHFAGRGFVAAQDGVQYFPTELDAMKIWTEQIKRYKDIAEKAGADVFLSPRVSIDRTVDKINAVQVPQAGRSSPTSEQSSRLARSNSPLRMHAGATGV